jgi:hypothetical protein
MLFRAKPCSVVPPKIPAQTGGHFSSVTGGPDAAYCCFSPRLRGDCPNIPAKARTDRFLSLAFLFFASSSLPFQYALMVLKKREFVKLRGQISSMMGEGLAACGFTRARNFVRDSRISDRDCAMASSVRFMESST